MEPVTLFRNPIAKYGWLTIYLQRLRFHPGHIFLLITVHGMIMCVSCCPPQPPLLHQTRP